MPKARKPSEAKIRDALRTWRPGLIRGTEKLHILRDNSPRTFCGRNVDEFELAYTMAVCTSLSQLCETCLSGFVSEEVSKTEPGAFSGWATLFNVAGVDGNCWARSCMQPGLDKGSYAQGRGYTSYHEKPRPVCMRNMLHGCPQPQPAADPENARCCYRPAYKKSGKVTKCETCGETAPVRVAEILNSLPQRPGVPCRHGRKHEAILMSDWTECVTCHGVWDKRVSEVRPFEPPNSTLDELLAEIKRRMAAVKIKGGEKQNKNC